MQGNKKQEEKHKEKQGKNKNKKNQVAGSWHRGRPTRHGALDSKWPTVSGSSKQQQHKALTASATKQRMAESCGPAPPRWLLRVEIRSSGCRMLVFARFSQGGSVPQRGAHTRRNKGGWLACVRARTMADGSPREADFLLMGSRRGVGRRCSCAHTRTRGRVARGSGLVDGRLFCSRDVDKKDKKCSRASPRALKRLVHA